MDNKDLFDGASAHKGERDTSMNPVEGSNPKPAPAIVNIDLDEYWKTNARTSIR